MVYWVSVRWLFTCVQVLKRWVEASAPVKAKLVLTLVRISFTTLVVSSCPSMSRMMMWPNQKVQCPVE